MANRLLSALVVVVASLSLVACEGGTPGNTVGNDGTPVPQEGQKKIGDDVYQALSLLPQATIEGVGAGGVPSMIKGQLSRVLVNPAQVTQADLAGSLAQIAPVFRVNAQNLAFQGSRTDALQITHVRYAQMKNGLPVVGGELSLHIDRTGVIYAANGSARDGINISATPTIDSAAAVAAARSARPLAGQSVGATRLSYVITSTDRSMHLAYEVPVMGTEDGSPVRDLVYVDAHSGQVVDRHATIESALNRKVYTANNGTSLPGTLKRSEGQAASSDAQVNYAYDNTGTTYNCYKTLFNRDSYDNSGATLISTVHYDQNYVNAYWDGTQMVYGDGNGTDSLPLAESLDVTAHELTHAVTERSSNLVYSYEPGAMNESMSDIFGAICESWERGSGNLAAGVTSDTWKVGEVIWTPGTPGDALRYMDNPTADGYSADYYPEKLNTSSDNGGVHGNSGISNLAFYLVSQGGTHPRNKTTVQVPAIGIEKAAHIFYRANTYYLTSNAQFADFRTATVQAATELYDQATADAMNKAWDAVGVPGGGGGGGGGGGVTVLTNGTAVGNLAATTGNKLYFTLDVPSNATNLSFKTSGGSGDGDLYVKFGSTPTSSSYDCRPYISGNNETCNISNVQAGTYYVMINAYSSFSGMSLVGSFSTQTQSNDFSVSLASGSATVVQGSSTTVTVNTAVTSGSAQTVSLSVSGLPAGVTGSFSPSSVTAGASSTLTLTASASATTGVKTFTVTGSATSGSHSTSGSLTVNASSGGGGSVLSNGVPVSNLSGASGSQQTFTLVVPSGASGLSFKLSGGSGDADLYVKFGSAPTTSSYDCRPYISGNNETCNITNVQAGTYYVMIRGYSSYSGASLVGSYSTGGGGGGNVLTNGVPVSNLSGASGSSQTYTLAVTSGTGSVHFAISGGSGDADLYVKFGSAPTTSSYDCRPYLNGNNESCDLTRQGGTYYVMVRGYQAYSGVSLVGSY